MVYERYADALLGAYDLNINPSSTTTSSSSSQTAGSDPRLQLLQLRNPWGQPPPGGSSSSAGGVGTWQGAWSDGAKEWTVVPHARAVTGYDQVSVSADRQTEPSSGACSVGWSG
jgi:hypothetical protein